MNEPLPVTSVTLFASGVAYIAHNGTLPQGDATVELTFKTAQMGDILKSLVLIDEKGSVKPITFPSKVPLQQLMGGWTSDIAAVQGFADLLRRYKGASASIKTNGGENIDGRIVTVESLDEYDAERRLVRTERLTIFTESGLTALTLSKIATLKLSDERLNAQLNDALASISAQSDDNKRIVELNFASEETHEVTIGYVVESPVWKVAYRLVLGSNSADSYLQGWAIVENTTEMDWNGIELSLISGSPVSFTQDLYTALYKTRPAVPIPGGDTVQPQIHGAAMEVYGLTTAGAPAPMNARSLENMPVMRSMAAKAVTTDSLQKSTVSQADGTTVGELFAYTVSQPITLLSDHSAMIPIVTAAMNAEKLSVYHATNDTNHPRNAVRVKNTTDLTLKGGAITLFDGGTYAGDALMETLLPDNERLLTYAVDLAVEIEQQRLNVRPTEIKTVAIRHGVLETSRKFINTTRYLLKNRSDIVKTVVIEHPFDPNAQLTEPQTFLERTADVYRFSITVAPSAVETLTVTQERPQSSYIALMDATIDIFSVETVGTKPSDALRKILGEIIVQRRAITDAESRSTDAQNEITRIAADQERIRMNLSALDRDNTLYKRYITELDSQETRLQTLRTTVETAQTEAQTLRAELKARLDRLDFDET